MQSSSLAAALLLVSALNSLFGQTSPAIDSQLSAAAATPSITWSSLYPAGMPTRRSYLAMAYDGSSQKIVLFGGYNGHRYLDDTWLFDGRRWRKVPMLN